MTEAELVEAVATFFALSLVSVAMYGVVTSSYLIVAFVAGTRLSLIQVTIVSALFLLIAGIVSYGATHNLIRGLEYANALVGTAPRGRLSGPPEFTWYVTAMAASLYIGSLAAVFFMWNVRQRGVR